MDAAKLSYQDRRGGPQAEPVFSRPGEHLRARTYASTGTSPTVVQRDDALLIAEEVQNNRPALMAAIKQGLETWVKCGCISRKKRKLARSITDVKWVLKWKFEWDAISVHESQRSGPAATRRVIRAQLSIRGV